MAIPWHKTNELTVADIGHMTTTPPLSTCETSDIVDGGDAKQLSQSIANVKSTPDYDQTTVKSDFAPKQTLEASLRSAMTDSVGHGSVQQTFVPVDDLDRIINTGARWELERLEIFPVEYYTRQICEKHEGMSPQQDKVMLTCRRRLFATLILIKKAPDIVNVIKEGIYDWDLPLQLGRSTPESPQLMRKGMGGKLHPVGFSQSWFPFQREAFCWSQRQLLSPYFEMPTEKDAKIKHYPLDPSTIIPITAVGNSHIRGGFSSVSMIKIHPAHRNLLSTGSDSWLARKKLICGSEKQFKAEVRTLKRLGAEHAHIIPLLATYQLGQDYYLLFPWADGGNLGDFFKKYPEGNSPPRNPRLSKWFASQLLGLSDALASIHNCELDPLAANVSGFESGEAHKIYGAHGDLKPENILWFQRNETEGGNWSLGTFKMADFGFTSFHCLESRSKFKPEGVSQTYRAPEYDLIGHVSQKYDMWSLGCVIAELVTWYLLGGSAITEFHTARLEDTVPGVKEDAYFSSLTDHPFYNHTGRAIEKYSVRKHFDLLRRDPGCTDFLLELIDFVDGRLLRMKPKGRCQIPELLEFMRSISLKCNEDSSYCLERITPLKVRHETELSEFAPQSMVQGLSNPRSSLETLPNIPGVRAARQNTMSPKIQHFIDRTLITGSTNLNLHIRQHQRGRWISTVREDVTPTTLQPHVEANKGGSARGDIPRMSNATLRQGLGAQHSSPAQQSDASSFYQTSAKATPVLVDKSVKYEKYNMGENRFSFSRIRPGIIRIWSTLRRR
ncbi:kinase-like domain-containing protein [Xylariaceae sp. AK1471]|nr:kinase-like domain-containing protein [Xylariaceae sp. AK1471]